MDGPRIAHAAGFTLLAGVASYGVWAGVGRLIEGSVLDDASLVIKFAAVFITLTLFEKLYSRLEGPAGH